MARDPDAASFARTMRTGLRPDGSRVAVMPVEALSKISDTDLEAMRLFLATLPRGRRARAETGRGSGQALGRGAYACPPTPRPSSLRGSGTYAD